MNWFIIIFGIVVVFFLVRLIFAARTAMSLEEARAHIDAGRAVLVDVREPSEWTQGVAKHAQLLPFSDLRRERSQWTPALEQLRGKKLLLYCQSGGRSGMVAAQLRKEGFDAVNLGSLARCQRGGWVVTAPGRDT